MNISDHAMQAQKNIHPSYLAAEKDLEIYSSKEITANEGFNTGAYLAVDGVTRPRRRLFMTQTAASRVKTAIDIMKKNRTILSIAASSKVKDGT